MVLFDLKNFYIGPETHKGLKRVTLIWFALSDAREYSFSKVPYLEREKKITSQSNFLNDHDVISLHVPTPP